ncbi:hypothetical protein A0H81_00733 [Grifola frondosa]|uniref:Uncharacterized protein n=1 Tax=Grifola frondosa TaxID=5627 RepID=A0A1C7MVP4_GRIFR|nr:hypothetical protein A0H81_00733 [Grifola frondosa]
MKVNTKFVTAVADAKCVQTPVDLEGLLCFVTQSDNFMTDLRVSDRRPPKKQHRFLGEVSYRFLHKTASTTDHAGAAEAAFRLVVLLRLRSTLTVRPGFASNVWEQWSKEKSLDEDLEVVNGQIVHVWSTFLEIDRSVQEIEEALWSEYQVDSESCRSLRVVDLLAQEDSPPSILSHRIVVLSLLRTWIYGRSDERSNSSTVRRLLSITFALVWHSLSRILYPVIAFFLPALLVSLFLLFRSLADLVRFLARRKLAFRPCSNGKPSQFPPPRHLSALHAAGFLVYARPDLPVIIATGWFSSCALGSIFKISRLGSTQGLSPDLRGVFDTISVSRSCQSLATACRTPTCRFGEAGVEEGASCGTDAGSEQSLVEGDNCSRSLYCRGLVALGIV